MAMALCWPCRLMKRVHLCGLDNATRPHALGKSWLVDEDLERWWWRLAEVMGLYELWYFWDDGLWLNSGGLGVALREQNGNWLSLIVGAVGMAMLYPLYWVMVVLADPLYGCPKAIAEREEKLRQKEEKLRQKEEKLRHATRPKGARASSKPRGDPEEKPAINRSAKAILAIGPISVLGLFGGMVHIMLTPDCSFEWEQKIPRGNGMVECPLRQLVLLFLTSVPIIGLFFLVLEVNPFSPLIWVARLFDPDLDAKLLSYFGIVDVDRKIKVESNIAKLKLEQKRSSRAEWIREKRRVMRANINRG
eukprot:SAG22_NODE_25_length_30107_cov_28.456412_15_plen_305_part_00